MFTLTNGNNFEQYRNKYFPINKKELSLHLFAENCLSVYRETKVNKTFKHFHENVFYCENIFLLKVVQKANNKKHWKMHNNKQSKALYYINYIN